jgi:hypothetical protein
MRGVGWHFERPDRHARPHGIHLAGDDMGTVYAGLKATCRDRIDPGSGIIRERLRQRPVFQVQEHACSGREPIAREQLHRIGAVRCPLCG